MKRVIIACSLALLFAGCSSTRKAEATTYSVPVEHQKAHQRCLNEQSNYKITTNITWKENQ